jgi:hypothetical protein
MKILRKLAIGAALIAGSSALASAQSYVHRDGGPEYRGRNWGQQVDHGRDSRQFVRNDQRFYGVRDDRRFNDDRGYFVREEPRYVAQPQFYVGQERFYNGSYWTWDGSQWCRRGRSSGITFSFSF